MQRITRLSLSLLAAMLLLPALGAEENEQETHYLPMAGWERLHLADSEYDTLQAGGAVAGKEFTLVGLYGRTAFGDPPAPGLAEAYHTIDLLYDGGWKRNQLLVLFKSESDRPVAGGLATFQTAAVYGYEVLARESLTLALGGGVALSDFGIDWPLLPVPFIRLNWETPLIAAGFDFITGPNFSFTLLPESRVRLKGDMRADQFRDIRDLVFETALEYRPVDMVGVSAGVKHDLIGFTDGAGGKQGDEYSLDYYALFSELDLTLLTLQGGFAFDGRDRLDENTTRRRGDGWFISLSGLYQF